MDSIKISKFIRMRYPNGKIKAITFSFDDGTEQDIQLIELMKKYDLYGTFNINSGMFLPEKEKPNKKILVRRMNKSVSKKLYNDKHIEVAVHGYTHPFLDRMPKSSALWDIILDRKTLEEIFEKPIRGMAYPFGTYNDDVIDVLKQSGIVYSRTTESSNKFDLPENWLTLHPTCHFLDDNLYELKNEFLNIETNQNPLLFYIWGHSFEIESQNWYNKLEEFFMNISRLENIWFATNIDIYDYTKAFESLEFSLECNYVRNPSCRSVWIYFDDWTNRKTVEIKSGETIKLEF